MYIYICINIYIYTFPNTSSITSSSWFDDLLDGSCFGHDPHPHLSALEHSPAVQRISTILGALRFGARWESLNPFFNTCLAFENVDGLWMVDEIGFPMLYYLHVFLSEKKKKNIGLHPNR